MNLKTLIAIILLAIISTIAFPVVNYYVTTPSFTDFVINQTEKKLIEIASNISSSVSFPNNLDDNSTLTPEIIQKIQETKKLFGLQKIKVFSPQGRIIYSTNPRDIGNLTSQDFFAMIIEENNTYSVLEDEEGADADDAGRTRTHVETYVPIVVKGGTIGAFEIYFDITDIRAGFMEILSKINLTVLVISQLLFISVLVCAFFAYKSLAIQKKIEAEKDKLIEDLSKAVKEIKALQGILPLCSYCKNIRNDEGYWERVDVYLQHHSAADISHSICPDCVKKHYPEEYEAIFNEATPQEELT